MGLYSMWLSAWVRDVSVVCVGASAALVGVGYLALRVFLPREEELEGKKKEH